MPNNYEIHIGFPVDEDESAKQVLEHLQSKQRGWVYSEVFSVDSNPDLLDPHNVPGTLGCLLSKDYPATELRGADRVFTDLDYVLQTLSERRIQKARVELEFVFGYSHHKKKDSYLLDLHTWATPQLDDDLLEFVGGERISETPNSEIHFILEPLPLKLDEPWSSHNLTTTEAAEIMRSFGVAVEQTIEYVSQAMRASNAKRRKLICTAYYNNPTTTEENARKLIADDRLIKLLADRGYGLKVVLERIFACFKPVAMEDGVRLPLPDHGMADLVLRK